MLPLLVRFLNTHPVGEWGPEGLEHLSGKLQIERLTPQRLLSSDELALSRRYAQWKRVLSVVLAAAGVVVTWPLMLVIALLIKLDSRGPVFFIQDRIGLGNRRFRVIKFRSMVPENGVTSNWAGDNKGRITRLGHWLRRFHLDELPQFLNVLRGDMDIVGPRPHPVSNQVLFEREIPLYGFRSMIRPGITGWGQIRYGYANDLAGETEKMRYDLYYILHQSLALDLSILLETVRVVLMGRDTPEPLVSSDVAVALSSAERREAMLTSLPAARVEARASQAQPSLGLE